MTDVMSPAPWMRWTLIAAALYNCIWGLLAVLFPMTFLGWFGLDPRPVYPEFWRCIGMIVGVYGIGYAIAARDPFRHWPIVLVGLLGKVFGPIGFLNAIIADRLPLSMGWTIFTNDLIWWGPFAVILWQAARASQSQQELLTLPRTTEPLDPLGKMLSQFGVGLRELSRNQPVLSVFLRHSGCTFCRETLSDIAAKRAEIEGRGLQIALVHMGKSRPVELLKRYGLTDLHCYHDPLCHLYDSFGLKVGGFLQLFGPKVMGRGIAALSAGHGIGRMDGNGLRMPGAFIIENGETVCGFRHRTAADRPPFVELIAHYEQQVRSAQVSAHVTEL